MYLYMYVSYFPLVEGGLTVCYFFVFIEVLMTQTLVQTGTCQIILYAYSVIIFYYTFFNITLALKLTKTS